ncbi:hypothetical protein BSR29_04480 [Boudabousia liubingyangii]|uniref:Major facilitator superfamily (MFS) profile domain-containing protein n=1 Tax=Boudabousia liubingyangii TaxID=1921764 RepID=A0A1Q5PNG3_9ACTO|nr:MFS transporter [Boudabousia liubingyangii]OKL47668.1 hypothetical protein BSR28_04045 [Boudabousia liubingyangii]OKL49094.1 hypothetical protein BSR29_04480 [Boudabousia liubingyangii]
MSEETETYYSPRLGWLLLIGASISICFAGFATLGVTTVLPEIAHQLDGEAMYPLANGTALAGQLLATAVAGAWCDSRGALKPLLSGLFFFIAGLVTCGLAPTMLIFVIGRMFQGLGGGLLMVSMYVLVGALVSPVRRPFFFGVFAGAWVVPALAGPYIASRLAEFFGWRAIFHVLVPAILAAAAVIFPLLRHVPKHRNPLHPRARKTVRGATVAFVALMVAQFGFTLTFPGAKLAAIIALVFLVLSLSAIFPPGTIRLKRGIPAMVASRGFINAAYVATETFIPQLLVTIHHWSLNDSAKVISAGAITWAAAAGIQSKIAGEKLRRHLPVAGGILAALGGIATAVAAFPSVTGHFATVGWCISAFGVGLSYPALSVLALESAPEEKHGYISSSLQLADSLGGAAALTIITTAFTYLANLPAPGPMLPALLLALGLSVLAAIAGRRIGTIGVK